MDQSVCASKWQYSSLRSLRVHRRQMLTVASLQWQYSSFYSVRLKRKFLGVEGSGEGGGGAKRRAFCGVRMEILWHNTFHVKLLRTKFWTNFKATQAKSQKMVVAKSLKTNAHAMIITSHIRTLLYRRHVPLKLYFTYKPIQIAKR